MKYGIIVCSKCKKAKGVDLSYKTTKCIRCNKVLKISQMKVLYETNSEQQLRQKIGLINAEIDGNLEGFQKILKKSKK